MRAPLFSLAMTLVALGGCGPAEESAGPQGPGETTPAVPRAAAGPALVVFLGDSLTAGYTLAEEEAFPALVERRLAAEGRRVRVVNAGVSGDTSSGGLARLDWLLAQRPQVLFVALGANDGMRGLSPAVTEENLRRIVRGAREAGARVVLAGMKLPPNLGPLYTRSFERIFPRLADELDVPLVPFLLEGVAGRPELNLGDGIHPNAEGHRRMVATVLPAIRDALDGHG